MSITFHHYNATVLNVPISHMRFNLQAILRMPFELVGEAAQATIALDETNEDLASTHTLTYRSEAYVATIAEYSVTCTLRPLADDPHRTFFEWTRVYRPTAAAQHNQVSSFASTLIHQDQAVVARLGTEYSGVEIFSIDYMLGATGDECVQDLPALHPAAPPAHGADLCHG